MAKAFDNYRFARDAWSLLVSPAWYKGIVRVGFLAAHDEKGGSGARTSPGPQYVPAPVRPGTLIYAQEVCSWFDGIELIGLATSEVSYWYRSPELRACENIMGHVCCSPPEG